MKKAIALLLTLVLAFSFGVVAFADAGDSTTTTNPPIGTSPTAGLLRTIRDETTNNAIIAAGELFLADTKNNIIVGTDTILLPNETYKFDIYVNGAAATGATNDTAIIAGAAKLSKANVGTGTVRFRTVKGSTSISSAKVKTTSGNATTSTYYVEIVTRNQYGTKINDVEYELSASVAGTGALPAAPGTSTNTFQVGYSTIPDEDTDVGEEGTIIIYNAAPVITKDQFADIAKSANYKNVTFASEDDNWSYKGKVAGMHDANFFYDFDPDTDLMNKFPDQEFKFVNFRAGVNFPTTGEMRINVSDISDDFGRMYAYLYRDGKLTAINGTYDSATDEIVFRTNYLGKFVITNKEITDTSLLPEEETPTEEVPTDEEENNNNYPNNPNTGASSAANIVVTLGVLSLASAAVVGKKRK